MNNKRAKVGNHQCLAMPNLVEELGYERAVPMGAPKAIEGEDKREEALAKL